MQPVAEAAAFHEAARELIHNDHLAFFVDNVVHIALVGIMGAQ